MTFTSYAQNLEDVILWRALKHVDEGFYIDVGAWSPDVDSVTRAFYERRWSGINVEPNPQWHHRLMESRPRDINLRVAISQQEGEMPFFLMSNPGLSTLDPSVSAHHVESGLTQTVLMTPTKRLETIWRENVGERDVHFLKIDVEGLEKQVIESNDWTKCRPWIAVVEATQPMSTEENHFEWEPILLGAGYVFVYADGLNRYYVASEHSELIASFRYPPNVFDDYRSSAIVALEHELAESKGREAGALEIVAAQRGEIKALERLVHAAQERANEATRYAEILQTTSPQRQGSAFPKKLDVYSTLRRIEVDLTPMLPGGANGGAKIFILTLLRALAAKHTDVEFILLTRAESHQELAALDRPNVRRELRLGAAVPEKTAQTVALLNPLARAGSVLKRATARALSTLERNGIDLRRWFEPRLHPPPRLQNADTMLFCPFTAPFYARAGVPVVSVLYDLQYRVFPEFFNPADAAERDRTFRSACAKSAHMASISEYSRQAAIETGLIPPERITTIHIRTENGTRPLPGNGCAVLTQLGLSPNDYFLYPANFWPHKNHENLFIGFAMARAAGMPKNIKLVCTGVLNERGEWLKTTLEKMDLADAVVLSGFLSDDALRSILRHARGLIFPSLYEGFGMPVVEAFGAGIPVACSHTGSLPEIAGDAARLFDPRIPAEIAGALQWLGSDEPMRDGFVGRGIERAHYFGDIDALADEYWDIFIAAHRANVMSGPGLET